MPRLTYPGAAIAGLPARCVGTRAGNQDGTPGHIRAGTGADDLPTVAEEQA